MQLARWAALFIILASIAAVGLTDDRWGLTAAGVAGAILCIIGAITDHLEQRRIAAMRIELAMHQRAEQYRRGNQRRGA